MRWTEEQSRAITARGGNLLLSAAAGSGKTTVLVERVVRLILEDGADVDRMLVVTFTRAAAADMRAKLSAKLNALAAQGDARCRIQSLKLEHANITTLHAFCANFLRANFESTGVDPAFTVLDDPVCAKLLGDALDEALEQAYAENTPELQALDFGRGPKGVRALVEALCKALEERANPEAWLAWACGTSEELITAWLDEVKSAAKRAIRSARLNLMLALDEPACPPQYRTALLADLTQLDAMLSLDEYDALFRALSEYKSARASGGKQDSVMDEAVLSRIKQYRESAKQVLKKIRLTELPLLLARADAQALAPQLRTLGALARAAGALYEQKKAEQSGLTYADLERRTLEALRNPDTARAARAEYDYIFVDEYQDTSDIQEALVGLLCRGDNLFMVGDVKQSIYRFRLAEPKLFMEKYQRYQRGDGGELLPLTRNFRSRPMILHYVNQVFESVMTGGDAEIEYDELARLNPGRTDVDDGAPVELHLMESSAQEDAELDDALAESAPAEREALFVARRIRELMAEDPTLRWRDFAILSRTKGELSGSIMNVLLAEGIPAYVDGQAGYFDAPEVMLALSLLQLVANARSDIELIGVLRSPVVGLSAEALARIRIAARDVPYIDAARRYAQGDDDIAEQLRAFFTLLDSWRLRAGATDLGVLARNVLDESGFYIYTGALPGGAQRQANLDRLVLSAARFDAEISGSLSRFLKYVEHQSATGGGEAAPLLGENDDVVRLMTVHHSKGLEFKVVFGVQLGHKYRAAKAAPLMTHRELGIGIQRIDPELRTRRKTLAQAAIAERQSLMDAAEEMRILYVLLTRAQERLVLLGTERRLMRAWDRWRNLSEALSAANSHLDLLMAAWCMAEKRQSGHFARIYEHRMDEWSLEALDAGGQAARETFQEVLREPERFADAALDAELSWQYPDEKGAHKPLKLTVSGMLRELEGPEVIEPMLKRPQFMVEESVGRLIKLTGAERGTAYHRAVQLLDLRALDGLDEVDRPGSYDIRDGNDIGDDAARDVPDGHDACDGHDARVGRDIHDGQTGLDEHGGRISRALVEAIRVQLDGLTKRRLMTTAQRMVISPSRLAIFLTSPYGRRLRAATVVRREWSFNVFMRVEEALTGAEAGRFGDEEILVQGTVDCCFIEDGQWVLLDYKTDCSDDVEAIAEHYRKQLHVYSLALERITGIPVKSRWLCLLASGLTIEV